jgi:hypothetical protein
MEDLNRPFFCTNRSLVRTLPTPEHLPVITVSSFTFYLTVSC